MFWLYYAILFLLSFQSINCYVISDFRKLIARNNLNHNNYINVKNSKISIIRNVETKMNSNKNDQTNININKINDYQWDLFTNYQLGSWKGVQTGYDPLNDDVADYMYTEVDLNYTSNDKKEVKHINSMVAGEIRADCEVCFDSERLKSKEIGVYTKGKLKSRLCYNSELRGPGSNPRGLSMEIILRHLDGRIRIIFGYSPDISEEAKAEGLIEDCQDSDTKQFFSLAYRLVLRDIVIVRERLHQRPLQIENNIDSMWSTNNVTPKDIYDSKGYQGQRIRMNMAGETSSEPLLTNNENKNYNILHLLSSSLTTTTPSTILDNNVSDDIISLGRLLSSSSSSSSNSGISSSNNNDLDQYIRLFPGGILLSAPKYILTNNNEIVDIRATWIHPTSSSALEVNNLTASNNNIKNKNLLQNNQPLQSNLEQVLSDINKHHDNTPSYDNRIIYSVDTKILFTEPAVIDSDVVYIKPPRLTDYYVDVLTHCQ